MIARLISALALVVVLSLHAAPGSAQLLPFVEAEGAGAAGHFGQAYAPASLPPLPAWRISAGLAPIPNVHLLAFWGRSDFRCSGGLCSGADVDFRSQGPGAAIRLARRSTGTGPWVQGELVRQTLSTDGPGSGESGEGAERSESAMGWGAGAGFGIALGSRFVLSPNFRISSYDTRMGTDPEAYAVVVATGGIALRVHLPGR